MRTFLFYEANGNATVTISADSYENAIDYLKDMGCNPDLFRCEDEEGEEDEAEGL